MKTNIKNPITVILIISYLCILLMHYTALTDRTELNLHSYVYNTCNSFNDVCLIFFPFLFFFKKNRFIILIPFTFICIISLGNIWYSYYFNSYIPYSLYSTYNNLPELSGNIIDALSPLNLLYVLAYLAVTYIITSSSSMLSQTDIKCTIIILIVTNILNFGVYAHECKGKYYIFKNYTIRRYTSVPTYDPAKSMFELGVIQNLICEIYSSNTVTPHKITDKELKILQKYSFTRTKSVAISQNPPSNFIIIVVESFLSETTLLKFSGEELTPYLSKLKNEGYYNGNMMSEIQKGESSDGQFIYMTGLLPTKQGITILDFFNNKFISFIHLIKDKYPQYTSRMIIPTSNTLWRQSDMCKKYGIDSLFSKKDSPHKGTQWLKDEEIFDLAIYKDKQSAVPFISIILTASTHSPYYKPIQPSTIKYPDSYTEKYINYLDAIHYADTQIGRYIDYLKKQSWYNNTTVFIMSDHEAHPLLFDMSTDKVSSDIPLYILNSPIPLNRSTNSKIYQSDIYPTILDIAGLKSKWRGIGQSLTMPDSIAESAFEQERRKEKESISSIMLHSDYFNHQAD